MDGLAWSVSGENVCGIGISEANDADAAHIFGARIRGLLVRR